MPGPKPPLRKPDRGPPPPLRTLCATVRMNQKNPDQSQILSHQGQGLLARLLARRHAIQRHAFIGGDQLGQTRCAQQCSGAVVAVTQAGHHGAANVAGARIVDHRLQTVTDLDSVLALRRSQQQQHPAISFFRSHAQVLVEIDRVVFLGSRPQGNAR